MAAAPHLVRSWRVWRPTPHYVGECPSRLGIWRVGLLDQMRSRGHLLRTARHLWRGPSGSTSPAAALGRASTAAGAAPPVSKRNVLRHDRADGSRTALRRDSSSVSATTSSSAHFRSSTPTVERARRWAQSNALYRWPRAAVMSGVGRSSTRVSASSLVPVSRSRSSGWLGWERERREVAVVDVGFGGEEGVVAPGVVPVLGRGAHDPDPPGHRRVGGLRARERGAGVAADEHDCRAGALGVVAGVRQAPAAQERVVGEELLAVIRRTGRQIQLHEEIERELQRLDPQLE